MNCPPRSWATATGCCSGAAAVDCSVAVAAAGAVVGSGVDSDETTIAIAAAAAAAAVGDCSAAAVDGADCYHNWVNGGSGDKKKIHTGNYCLCFCMCGCRIVWTMAAISNG